MPDPSPSRPGQPAAAAQQPHALTFRVMRLTTPLPALTNPPPLIPIQSPSSHHLCVDAPPWQAEGAPCGVGHLTVLPSSFGSIYASETFRCFISVFNRSADPVSDVSVTIHMQTASSRRIPLFDSSETPRATLHPRTSINNIVTVPLTELAVHVLVCTATYHHHPPSLSSPPTSRTLRQFFRFTVLPPLDPSPYIFPLYRNLETLAIPPLIPLITPTLFSPSHSTLPNPAHYIVHVRVHNAIPLAVYNTSASFTPTAPFNVRLFGNNGSNAAAEPTTSPLKNPDANIQNQPLLESRRATMGGGDTRNFIFLIFPYAGEARRLATKRPDNDAPDARPRDLGRVVIKWRSAHGEHGTVDRVIKASQIATTPPEAVSVSIYAVPHQVKVHQPFVARCAARNNTGRPVRLYLQIRRDLVGEIVPVGVSGVLLGQVGAGEIARCAVTLIALVRGQHNICGVRVVDMESNVSFKADMPTISVS